MFNPSEIRFICDPTSVIRCTVLAEGRDSQNAGVPGVREVYSPSDQLVQRSVPTQTQVINPENRFISRKAASRRGSFYSITFTVNKLIGTFYLTGNCFCRSN